MYQQCEQGYTSFIANLCCWTKMNIWFLWKCCYKDKHIKTFFLKVRKTLWVLTADRHTCRKNKSFRIAIVHGNDNWAGLHLTACSTFQSKDFIFPLSYKIRIFISIYQCEQTPRNVIAKCSPNWRDINFNRFRSILTGGNASLLCQVK